MINHVTRQLLTRIGFFPGKLTQPHLLHDLVRALRIVPISQDLVRIGPDGDGGYLLPDDLEGIAYGFSPGVADCSDFELDLANRGIHFFLADKSVTGPATQDPRFQFVPKFIASTSSVEEGLITMDDWCRESLGGDCLEGPDLLLQMDIEGAEYLVLHNISDALLQRFRVIVVEFHRFYQLVDRFSFRWMAPGLHKLLRNHAVVHMHPNNNRRTLTYAGMEFPTNLEVTLLRRDRLIRSDKALSFPHPLDADCNPSKPTLVLPRCWHP